MQVPGLFSVVDGDTGSQPIINSLKSASQKPLMIFVATLLDRASPVVEHVKSAGSSWGMAN